VDDDEVIRMGLKKLICKYNPSYCVVAELSDGAYALEVMKKGMDIDVVITDIRMPVMDGQQLISEIRKFNQSVKIIVLSGFDDFKYVRNAFRDGAVDYLLKPIKREDLRQLLYETEQEIIAEQTERENTKLGNQLIVSDIMQRILAEDAGITPADCEKLNLDFARRYLVVVFQMDKYYKERTSKEDTEYKLKQIDDEVKKWFADKAEILIHTQGSLLTIFIFSEDVYDFGDICNMYNHISKVVGEQTTLSLGTGLPHFGIQEVGQGYHEALDAVESRFYMGRNQCIEYSEIEKKSMDFDYDLEENVNELGHAIELFDYVKARSVIKTIFIDLSFIKPMRFRKYIMELIDMLTIRIKDFDKALLCNEPEYRFYIEDINTFNELQSFTFSIIKSSIHFLEAEKKKRSLKRIEMAKQYIKGNYMNPLSLNMVADYVELNPSYFSDFFKTETGKNFSEYLLEIRMEKAMLLLRDPKIKIYKIGNMVGYEDAVSFGRAFKKKIGMSPKEYRNTVY
jgi:two-component system response regulator YesN